MDGYIHVRGGQAEWVKGVLFNFECLIDGICKFGKKRFLVRGRNGRVGCGRNCTVIVYGEGEIGVGVSEAPFFEDLSKEGREFDKALLLIRECLSGNSGCVKTAAGGREKLCFFLFFARIVGLLTLTPFAGSGCFVGFLRV